MLPDGLYQLELDDYKVIIAKKQYIFALKNHHFYVIFNKTTNKRIFL